MSSEKINNNMNGEANGTTVSEGKVNLGFIGGETETEGITLQHPSHHVTFLGDTTHHIFSEMDVLDLKGERWIEQARWIKYEQNVDDETDRWSKPHVSSLSFNSLIELRKCLEYGSFLLDVEDEVLPDILDRITNQLVSDRQLHELDEGIFKWTLQLKHKYMRPGSTLNQLAHLGKTVREEGRPTPRRRMSRVRKNSSSARRNDSSGERRTSESSDRKSSTKRRNDSVGVEEGLRKISFTGVIDDEERRLPFGKQSSVSLPDEVKLSPEEKKARALKNWAKLRDNLPKVTGHKTRIDFGHLVRDIMELNHAEKFVKHIPSGAEAGVVLVGEADFLDHPVCAFVRLSEGREMGILLTEVPLPVRYIFIYLVPEDWDRDVTEVGRTMGTLLSNPRFKHVAYDAAYRQDLLDGFDKFMDDSLVLPIGQHYDQETLLPILHKLMKKEREVDAEIHDISYRKDMERQGLRAGFRASIDVMKKGRGAEEEEDEKTGDPLVRTKKLFGGVINEVKQRYPKYWSDITDGLNTQCLGAILFIYFAALAPAITFGGLMSDKTEKWIGVSETFLMSSICGLIFAFVSTQPLIIIGVTGPILVFEESLYQICKSLDMEYLAVHFWVGIWLAIIATVIVAMEGSVLVRYVSRFTQDIFALLISLIFIYESLYKLYVVFDEHPLEEFYYQLTTIFSMSTTDPTTNVSVSSNMSISTSAMPFPSTSASSAQDEIVGQPNTALLSLVWCIGTFWLATTLKAFKTSHYLGKTARRIIGDFAIPLAILIMVVADYLMKDTYTEKLFVPDGIQPTDASKRGWLVNPLGKDNDLPIWAIFLAIIPAFLVFILIFMEAQITSLIVNKNLVKGTGYHLDLNLLGLFGIIAGVLGLPLVCGATVRSVTHLNALCVFSRTYAPGEKAKLEYVREQRITAFFVFLLLGLSILLGPVLIYVPLAVLFGVFLYMGVSSLNGIQFWDRMLLVFKPVKHHPDVGYVRRVRTYKMHLYTGIQFLILVILWIVKSTQASLAFPFLLILCIPVRKFLLPKLYTESELNMLDADDDKIVEEEGDTGEQVAQAKW